MLKFWLAILGKWSELASGHLSFRTLYTYTSGANHKLLHTPSFISPSCNRSLIVQQQERAPFQRIKREGSWKQWWATCVGPLQNHLKSLHILLIRSRKHFGFTSDNFTKDSSKLDKSTSSSDNSSITMFVEKETFVGEELAIVIWVSLSLRWNSYQQYFSTWLRLDLYYTPADSLNIAQFVYLAGILNAIAGFCPENL